jgi:hypothetical protein
MAVTSIQTSQNAAMELGRRSPATVDKMLHDTDRITCRRTCREDFHNDIHLAGEMTCQKDAVRLGLVWVSPHPVGSRCTGDTGAAAGGGLPPRRLG